MQLVTPWNQAAFTSWVYTWIKAVLKNLVQKEAPGGCRLRQYDDVLARDLKAPKAASWILSVICGVPGISGVLHSTMLRRFYWGSTTCAQPGEKAINFLISFYYESTVFCQQFFGGVLQLNIRGKCPLLRFAETYVTFTGFPHLGHVLPQKDLNYCINFFWK